MKAHKNIAIFIPHRGCKNDCVFCSQAKITGVKRQTLPLDEEIESVKKIISESIPTLGGARTEIAFFGGSFTGIEKERMTSLLKCASDFIGGDIIGIRCSTRPDYIDGETCELLKEYGVTAVEIGVQSTSDKVLYASKRGHGSDIIGKACSIIKSHGFELGCQMMVGLPLSSEQDEIQTAKDIVSFGADACRIYPVVVFKSTPLYKMALSGEYTPLSVEESALRAAKCGTIFIENNIKILKIGLHSSVELSDAPFGANHPAIGELAEGEIYYNLITKKLDGSIPPPEKDISVYIPRGELSKCIGQKGVIRERLSQKYGRKIKFIVDEKLEKYFIRI